MCGDDLVSAKSLKRMREKRIRQNISRFWQKYLFWKAEYTRRNQGFLDAIDEATSIALQQDYVLISNPYENKVTKKYNFSFELLEYECSADEIIVAFLHDKIPYACPARQLSDIPVVPVGAALHDDKKTLTASLDIDFSQNDETIIQSFATCLQGLRFIYGLNPNSEYTMDSFYEWKLKQQGIILRDSDMSRAVGLWLWDFVDLEWDGPARGALAHAIRQFEKTYELEDLGLGNSDQSHLRKLYKYTDKCIQAHEILPFVD